MYISVAPFQKYSQCVVLSSCKKKQYTLYHSAELKMYLGLLRVLFACPSNCILPRSSQLKSINTALVLYE